MFLDKVQGNEGSVVNKQVVFRKARPVPLFLRPARKSCRKFNVDSLVSAIEGEETPHISVQVPDGG